VKELEFLEQSKDIIDQINSLSNDSEKINNIVTYLSKANALLLEYTIVINDLLSNQKIATQTLNINLDSMSKLNDRVVEIEKYVEIHANLLNKHVETYGKNLETVYQRFDTNDKILDILTQSIEVHDNRFDIIERHLDRNDQNIDAHDEQLEVLSQKLDLLG
jgi:DNA repair ATPase RecN